LLEPELFEPDPEPMFGHGCFPGVVDLDCDWPWGGVVGVVGVVEVDAADSLDGVWLVLVATVFVVGAAAAPAMPAAAPPAATAPATIVAPSSLEMCTGDTSWGDGLRVADHRATGG